MAEPLPERISGPIVVDGRVVARVVHDLTVYIADPTRDELDALIDIYRRLASSDRIAKYKIAEFPGWSPVGAPRLTETVRAAMEAGAPRPGLAPVYRRIEAGRGFELRFWDGREIEEEEGSWSFACLKVARRAMSPVCIVRFLLPLAQDAALLEQAALEVAARVRVRSGHGGYAFAYHPYRKVDAFSRIYALARRYWCIDVEDLNATARARQAPARLKTIGWLTLLGPEFLAADGVESGLGVLAESHPLGVARRPGATVLRLGDGPVAGDSNRPGSIPQVHFHVGGLLSELLYTEHPAFEGAAFGRDDATLAWIRRFAEPEGWAAR